MNSRRARRMSALSPPNDPQRQTAANFTHPQGSNPVSETTPTSTSTDTGNLERVLQLQSEVDDLLQQMERLRSMLSDNSRRADRIRADLPPLEDLQKQRSYLAAGVAMGTATKASLEEAEADIEAARQQHAKAQLKLTELADLAGGIEQHRAECEQRLRAAESAHRAEARTYLRGLIEAAGADYAAAAAAVEDAYERLLGLSTVFGDFAMGELRHMLKPKGGNLLLPGFDLATVLAHPKAMADRQLYPRTEHMAIPRQRSNEIAAARLVAEKGIRLPE